MQNGYVKIKTKMLKHKLKKISKTLKLNKKLLKK